MEKEWRYKMKKLFFVLLAAFLSAASFNNASSLRKSEYEYLNSLSGVKKILAIDTHYKKALSLLRDKRKMLKKSVFDPESKKKIY